MFKKKNVAIATALLFTLLMGVFLVGCSKTNTKRAQSLERAYFDIAEKIEKKEEIEEAYIKSLLSEYDYEKGDTIKEEESNRESQLHIYKDKEEKLTIANVNSSGDQSIELFYEKGNDKKEASLSYASSKDNLYANIIVNELKSYEQISAITDIEDSVLLKKYNEISKELLKGNSLKIDTIKSLIKIKPTVEDTSDANTSAEVTCYSFREGSEVLSVYTLKGTDYVSRISYGNNDSMFIKSTINKELLETGDNTISTITVGVDCIERQSKIISTLFEE